MGPAIQSGTVGAPGRCCRQGGIVSRRELSGEQGARLNSALNDKSTLPGMKSDQLRLKERRLVTRWKSWIEPAAAVAAGAAIARELSVEI